MRLHFGPIPEDHDFHPDAEGWSGIREPSPVLIQVIALPIALVTMALLAGLAALFWRGSLIRINPDGYMVAVPVLPLLLSIILLIPVHELLHAAAHPKLGLSPNTVLGLWLSRAVFYAHYEGVLSRNQFLRVGGLPFLVLSLLPIGLMALLVGRLPPEAQLVLAAVSLVNGAASSGDLLGILLVLSQIPRSACVRNKGWRTFWKMCAPPET
jgi:hypothetical protein